MVEFRWRFMPALLCSMLALLCGAACESKKSADSAGTDSAVPLESDDSAVSGEQAARKKKRSMPPAAFDACQDKGLGDACTVTVGAKAISAKCAAVPDGRLACPPEPREHAKPN
jgi:hypothetical protein